MHSDTSQFEQFVASFFNIDTKEIVDPDIFFEALDELVYDSQFAPSEIQQKAHLVIYELAKAYNCQSSSIRKYYEAIRDGKTPPFTTPAINQRAITYDIARLLFRLMQKHQIGAIVFEISHSESDYTDQTYQQFSSAVLGAALKENYQGPVFLQADHTQASKDKFSSDYLHELNDLKDVIRNALSAHVYNIDIDASTLVDYSKSTVQEQQRDNIIVTSELLNTVRMHEPADISVSVGGEVGHIGDTNTTHEEVETFLAEVAQKSSKEGIQKLSIQTGTEHGGDIDGQGHTLPMPVDFDLLNTLGDLVKKEFSLCGVVQHGASTLPMDDFAKFPTNHTLEIHLATGIQNVMFDYLPEALKKQMLDWVETTIEKDPNLTDAQHLYRNRKKSIGQFKKDLWELPDADKQPILDGLTTYFEDLFSRLQITNTRELMMPLYA
jgi:fructose/tagatose bisphosphate aldolase